MQPDLIESRPNGMMGKPVVRDTRINVAPILEKLAAGESITDPEVLKLASAGHSVLLTDGWQRGDALSRQFD